MKLILLALTICFSVSAFAEFKVGIVDIKKIMESVKEGKSVNKSLTKTFKIKEKDIKKDEAEIKKLQKAFQKQSLVISDKAKVKKQQEIAQKVQAYRMKTQKYQGEIQKLEAQLKQPILEKLSKVIESVSKSEGVELTFERSSSPIVYAKTKVELSDKVIKAYDKKHSK